MSTYDDYVEAIRKYLRDQGATSSQKTKKMREIVAGVKDQFDKRLSENSLNNYLNHAAHKDNKSGIISEGPHRGYWLDEDALKRAPALEIAQEPESPDEAESVPEKRVRVRREVALYEPAKQWLLGNSYRAKIIADMRGGAKWSNPDVLGIRVSKNFGLTDIEIVSIEVKTGNANWRQDIFEAIAHKRFANRVYFCYPVEEGLDKLDDEIRRYSELYRVGVLQLYLEKDALATLRSSQSSSELPDLSAADIEERIPAPYDFIPPRYQIEFLKGLGLGDEEGLWTFGSDDEDLGA
jgi:hypothetical protein